LIRTTAELAVSNGRTNEEYQQDMVQILAEAERTSHLIDSLLVLARADSGDDGLQMEPTDFAASVHGAAEQANSLARERQVGIEVQLEPRPLVVSGDADALRRLIFILLDNAIKYNEAGGKVQVKVVGAGAKVICTLADTGIGIASHDLEHIFDRFWRADRVRSRGQGGAGIGLSIARWIVDRHRGTMSVTSTVGQGTTFTITLPAISVSGAAQF
jgi:signal transduction histidine kinase